MKYNKIKALDQIRSYFLVLSSCLILLFSCQSNRGLLEHPTKNAEGVESCSSVSSQDLQAFLKKHQEIRELVFFASWCRECLKRLNESSVNDAVFVGVFDDFDRINRVMESSKAIKADRCFYDMDGTIAQKYSLKSLPTKIPVQ